MRCELVDLLADARQEALRMDSIARKAKDGDTISMRVEQFRKLSQIILNLCECYDQSELVDEWSPKFWVPLGVFRNLKQKYDAIDRDQAARADFILKK